ncbi:MAG: hypothetical protein AAF996_13265 [Pseudomonadota bacterium]
MRPFNPARFVAATCSILWVSTAATAAADAVNFCTTATNCKTIYVQNNAAVTVKKVNITQQKGDDSCESGLKKTVSRDMAGGTGIIKGQSYNFSANPDCKYKVKFVTTSGCTGDKTTHVRRSDFEAGKNIVKLSGPCGWLKTKVATKNNVSE